MNLANLKMAGFLLFGIAVAAESSPDFNIQLIVILLIAIFGFILKLSSDLSALTSKVDTIIELKKLDD